MKMHKQVAKFGVVLGALVAVSAVSGIQQAQAADSANTVVNLEMQDLVSITATASINVVPTLPEIVAGSVTTTGNPITLTIDSTNGSEVTLTGNGGNLADEDLELSSDNGATWVAADDADTTVFYTSSATQNAATVPVKVRISNLGAYEVGTYANTVTFTVVAAD